MSTYIPPGWPAGVHPPGSEEFESTAVGWLLDVVPPDYRLHGVLRRYPVALATMARHHSKACVEGAREGYRTARTELAGVLPPHAVDTVLAAYRKEGARLAETARAVDLVERALRGEVFTPKMSPPPTAAARPRARDRGRGTGGRGTGGRGTGGRRAEGGGAQGGRTQGSGAEGGRDEGGREEGGCGGRERGGAGTGGGAPEFGQPGEERPGQNVRRWHQASRGGLLDM